MPGPRGSTGVTVPGDTTDAVVTRTESAGRSNAMALSTFGFADVDRRWAVVKDASKARMVERFGLLAVRADVLDSSDDCGGDGLSSAHPARATNSPIKGTNDATDDMPCPSPGPRWSILSTR